MKTYSITVREDSSVWNFRSGSFHPENHDIENFENQADALDWFNRLDSEFLTDKGFVGFRQIRVLVQGWDSEADAVCFQKEKIVEVNR